MPIAKQIRMYRRDRNWVVDSGGRNLPEIHQLRAYLPASVRITTQHCRSIEEGLREGINPQMLSSALSAWYVDHPNATGEVMVSEGVSELPENTALLALGNYIYRMVPVRQVKLAKAVRLMREKVRQEVERLRVQLVAQAQRETLQLIEQARVKADSIRADAEKERRAYNDMSRFPLWTRGYVLLETVESQQLVQFPTSINFTGVVHGERRWALKEGACRSIVVELWLPLNGNPELVRLVRGPLLPHISLTGACMKIGEAIHPIDSSDNLMRFANQISRAMGIINLASLLNPRISTWVPEVAAMLPDSIKGWLLTTYDRELQRQGAGLPPATSTIQGEEAWSVQ